LDAAPGVVHGLHQSRTLGPPSTRPQRPRSGHLAAVQFR
jgi:hypothetical protein